MIHVLCHNKAVFFIYSAAVIFSPTSIIINLTITNDNDKFFSVSIPQLKPTMYNEILEELCNIYRIIKKI